MASISWVQYPLSVGERVAGIPVRVRLSGVEVTDLDIDTARSSSGVSLRKENDVIVYRELGDGVYELYIARSTIYDGRSFRENELPVGARNAIGITLYDVVSGVRTETIYIDTQPEFATPTSPLLSEFVDDFETTADNVPVGRDKWTIQTGGMPGANVGVLQEASLLNAFNLGDVTGWVNMFGHPCSGYPIVVCRMLVSSLSGAQQTFGLYWLSPTSGGDYSVNVNTFAHILARPSYDLRTALLSVRDCAGSISNKTVGISDIIEDEYEEFFYVVTLGVLYDGTRSVLFGGGKVLAEIRGSIGSYASGGRWRAHLQCVVPPGDMNLQIDRIAAYGFASPPSPAMFGAAELWQQESASEYFDPQPLVPPTSITDNDVHQLTTDGLAARKRYLLKQIGGYRISYCTRTSPPTVDECRYGDALQSDVPVILVPRYSGTHVYACKTVDGTSDATVFLIPLDGGTI